MENGKTRERILHATHDRFTHQGFANTAVREICEDVGVTALSPTFPGSCIKAVLWLGPAKLP
jgi:hypothetical protein